MLKFEVYWVTAKFRKIHSKAVLTEIYEKLKMHSTELYQEEFKAEVTRVCKSITPLRVPTPETIVALAKAKERNEPLDEIKSEYTEFPPPFKFGLPFPQDIEQACEKMGYILRSFVVFVYHFTKE